MPKDERHWYLEIACTTKPGVQEVERRLAESNHEDTKSGKRFS